MGIFSKFFKKKEQMVPFDLSVLGTDLHSHLIPGIDDGSKSLEESLELAKGLVDLGYSSSIITPHIMSDFYKNTPAIIHSGYELLKKALDEADIPLEINAAAEYYVDFEFLDKICKGDILTFGNNKKVLIECSFVEAPKILNEAIFELQTNGYKPILAHPERYIYWHQDFSKYEELKNRDVPFQLNLLSLTGYYSPMVKWAAEELIRKGWVDILGTDLHNLNQLSLLKEFKVSDAILPLLESTDWKNKKLLY
jgi:tyrosine-protein phosphatase YwqE